MIYLSTFILALFFTRIACALPQACHGPDCDPDPIGDGPIIPKPIPIPRPLATYSDYYDNPTNLVKNLACAGGPNGLLQNYTTFGELPHFPNIVAVPGLRANSTDCFQCWLLKNRATHESAIFVLSVDTSREFYTVSEAAFERLNGGELGNEFVWISASITAIHLCTQP